jgi:hypothetical protein
VRYPRETPEEEIVAYSVDMTLKQLLDDPKSKAVLERHFPNHSQDPRLSQVLYESLRSIAYYPEAGISSAKLSAVDADLKAL